MEAKGSWSPLAFRVLGEAWELEIGEHGRTVREASVKVLAFWLT
jgi:hypothetical protein